MKDINLLPKSYKDAKKVKLKKAYVAAIAGGIAVVLILAIALPVGEWYSYSQQNKELKENVAKTGYYLELEKQVKFVNSLYDQREKEAAMLKKYGVNVRAVLDRIEKAVPNNLFLKSSNIVTTPDGSVTIDINAYASSEDDVATFINKLRKDVNLKNIKLSTANTEGLVKSYKITINFKPGM